MKNIVLSEEEVFVLRNLLRDEISSLFHSLRVEEDNEQIRLLSRRLAKLLALLWVFES